jgi:hypothetical protein
MTDGGNAMGDPWAVDEDKALDALSLIWGDEYQVWMEDGRWYAHHKDAPDSDALDGSTPDEVNRQIRDDWAGRGGLHRGPAGMPPS